MSKDKTLLIVADIDEADYQKLINLKLSHVLDTSWHPKKRRDSGFRELLRQCGIGYTGELDIQPVIISVGGDSTSVESYFADFRRGLRKEIALREAQHKQPVIVVLNLMPFCLSATFMDKIVLGLFARDSEALIGTNDRLLIMMRNIDWLARSMAFSGVRRADVLPSEVYALDIRGFAVVFRNGEDQVIDDISREAYRQILDTRESTIYSSLVFGTNAYIGHYALRHSHVRTHYDLCEFIMKDSTWEYLYAQLLDLIGESQKMLFIGIGLEEAVLMRMGEQLKSILGERRTIDFGYLRDPTAGEAVSADWSLRYDLVLVLTDIVNSGKTLAVLIRRLRRTNAANKPIKAFAITKMGNSDSAIEGVPLTASITIKRPYYPKDPNRCPLCKVQQPLTKVSKGEDFHAVDTGQLTPLDFWEIVRDSRALLQEEVDPQGRRLSYRVDTERIVKRYSNWLRNVIAHEFAKIWPNTRPDVICTVEEDTGIEFSRLVSRAIGGPVVVPIHRDVLRRATPGGGLPAGFPNPFSEARQVLVADDGINAGGTFSSLVTFCRLATGQPPMGGIVLDSRLDLPKEAAITSQMGGAPLLALYRWPARSGRL